jgi:DNA-binding CsgD family transcriptional regulator
MNPENVRKLLKAMNVELRPAHIADNRYTKTSSNLTPHQLLQEIKELYIYKKMSGKQIAEKLGIDQGTVTTKLRALGIPIRHNTHKYVKGGYRCQWCGEIMETVYHIDGKRKQLYCTTRCRNKAKGYRRLISGTRTSQTRLAAMESDLRQAWGKEYHDIRRKILDAKPAMLSGSQQRNPADQEIHR